MLGEHSLGARFALSLPASPIQSNLYLLFISLHAPTSSTHAESLLNNPNPMIPLSTATSASFLFASSSCAVLVRYCVLIVRARVTCRERPANETSELMGARRVGGRGAERARATGAKGEGRRRKEGSRTVQEESKGDVGERERKKVSEVRRATRRKANHELAGSVAEQ